MFSFSCGYYAICQGPGHKSKLLYYKISQAILCIFWFIFSIIEAGPFDGWAKINDLSDCNLGFNIFLAVLQSIAYLVASVLGVFCIFKSIRVSLSMSD